MRKELYAFDNQIIQSWAEFKNYLITLLTSLKSLTFVIVLTNGSLFYSNFKSSYINSTIFVLAFFTWLFVFCLALWTRFCIVDQIVFKAFRMIIFWSLNISNSIKLLIDFITLVALPYVINNAQICYLSGLS
jgi:hypothetical protein